MAGIVNKLKDAVLGGPKEGEHSTTGTHNTGDYSSTTGTHTGQTGYGSSNTGSYGQNTTSGPHNSNIENKLDPRVDSDRDGSRTAGTTGTTGYGSSTSGEYGSNTGSGTTGQHAYGIAQKLDPRTDSNTEYTSGTGGYGSNTNTTSQYQQSHHPGSGTTGGLGTTSTSGPHNSSAANKLDPRVDSDRDGSRTAGTTGNYGSSTGTGNYGSSTGTGNYGSSTGTDNYGSSTGTGYNSSSTTNTSGPHNSSLLNKLDPRVDSDRDGSKTAGNTGNYGSSTTGSGYNTSSGTDYNQAQHGVSSLLSDDVASKVDSNHQHSGLGGAVHHGNHGMSDRFEDYTTTGSGGLGSSTSTGYGSTTDGPHNSNVANKLDPRVDSDRDGSRTAGSTGQYGSSGYDNTSGNTYGSSNYGNTGNTSTGGSVAPHNSSLLNKLDPRVDTASSNTTGTTGTTGQSGEYGSGYDNRDASKVPPSQFGSKGY